MGLFDRFRRPKQNGDSAPEDDGQPESMFEKVGDPQIEGGVPDVQSASGTSKSPQQLILLGAAVVGCGLAIAGLMIWINSAPSEEETEEKEVPEISADSQYDMAADQARLLAEQQQEADASAPEGPKSRLSRTLMLVFAVTLHNIPEGMAVGVVFAGMTSGTANVSAAAAFALSLGIAIQNFPEGAIISMPLRTEGNSKAKSFWYGMLSGAVEPVAAVITILLTETVLSALPYFLSFAAGAMIYVVIEELIPEATRDDKTDVCTIGFAVGFALMMVLDVALS